MRRLLEAITLIELMVLVWITFQALNGPHPLPPQVPTHFAANGQANAWGPSSSLWILPAIAAGIYGLMTVVSLFPGSFNFPVRVTPLNRPRLEQLALGMIAWLKAELACLFLWIQVSIVRSVRSGQAEFPTWIMPVFLVVVFGTVAGHIAAMVRAGRRRSA